MSYMGRLRLKRISQAAVSALALQLPGANAGEVSIQLPPEERAFKQDRGAEIANAQCLICHSVEYVSTQPPLPRAFWKSSVQKMREKYGAPIAEEQVEALADYLVRNYGVGTNGAAGALAVQAAPSPATVSDATQGASAGAMVATKYGCFGCHNVSVKVIGPAYKDIGAKYKADPAALARIEQQVHKGGSGKWGPVLMPPFPQISEAETRALADWILGMK